MEASLPQVTPDGDAVKGIYFIAISQFGISFSFNCIMSFMPFYILKVSGYDEKQTMLWIGMIMGATSMVAAFAAPFWGSLTTRIRPKLLFQAGIFCNGVIFFIMGFVESLPLLLSLRLIQGILGGVSTIGLVLITVSAPKDRLPKYMSLFQNSLTAGQLIGPPLGAYAVTLFGYHFPFIIALVVVFFSLVYCHNYVRDIPPQPKSARRGKQITGGILWGWGLTIVGTIQLMFLPSILPHILEGFQLTGQAAITTVGKMAAVVPESLRFCFEVITRSTALEGAELFIEEVPVVARCRACGNEWTLSGPVFRCPACDSGNVEMVSGRELDIVSIEVEKD